MDKNIENEIRRLIDVYNNSTKELKKSGYLEPVLNMLKDPAVVKHIMSKYDMEWKTPDEAEYLIQLDIWRKLLNKAQAAQNVNPDVLDALLTHIVDMTTVRPDKNVKDDRIKKSYGYTSPEEDAEQLAAAEPMEAYGNTVAYNTDNEWNSIRRGHRPKKGVPVLVAGWYYAGAVEQCIGVWKGNGQWDLRLPDAYNRPKFTPLLWRHLPEVPDYIMDEVPDEV